MQEVVTMEARAIPLLLILYATHVHGLPPCPYSNAAGDHHFVPPGVSKTIHIHQPFWETGPAYSWNEAQDFCKETYNNGTYSGGRLWEPQTVAEYNAVRTELAAVFPLTGQACMWWIGVKSPGAVVPKDAFKASDNSLISWHTVGYNHGWGSSDCVSMHAGWPFMTGDVWGAYDCDEYKKQWICESVHQQVKRCETTKKCYHAFQGLRGFCSDVSWFEAGCKYKDDDGNILCDERGGFGCACCKECSDMKCSDKGAGWECVNDKVASEYPPGTCVYDGSCKQTGSTLLESRKCGCCFIQDKTSTTTTTRTTTTTTSTTTAMKDDRCETTRRCKHAFPGLRGFCSDKSWLGGGCKHKDDKGNILCEDRMGQWMGLSCTCCKECLDQKCSNKGLGWECVNGKVASEYPPGACVYDGSCKRPDTPLDLDPEKCACCFTEDKTSTSTSSTSTSTTTTKEPPQDCDDAGCEKELNGLGSCVNVADADWQNLNTIYQLSTPSRPGLCKHPHSRDCCACLKKRECVDLGCTEQWNGSGVCLNVTSKEFAEKSHFIDFSAGGRDDLCRSGIQGKDCCTCFKLNSKKNEAADCCAKKTVGGVEYVLAEVYEDAEDVAGLGCKDGCVYVARNGEKFCFKPGKFPSSCP